MHRKLLGGDPPLTPNFHGLRRVATSIQGSVLHTIYSFNMLQDAISLNRFVNSWQGETIVPVCVAQSVIVPWHSTPSRSSYLSECSPGVSKSFYSSFLIHCFETPIRN